ncbi:multicopper oxidase [Colletotrichum caudatum]|nr:multicopper oxidase [Colletotrichum caudatum]
MLFWAPRFAAAMALLEASSALDWTSPEYRYFYQFPLPIPPLKQPKMSINNPVTNKPIDYYEVDIMPFKKQIYPDRGPASLVGYDGMSPGPTFMVPRGRETVVRFTNKAFLPSAVHLHGSPTRAVWDGWAEDRIFPGQYKDYYYPNSESARYLWYHDHAMEITSINSYFGQAGAYIVQDPAEDALGLPSGYGVSDIPLILTSKVYNSDGSPASPGRDTETQFGDVVHVNGQPWPFFQVEPRRYRLRFLNAAVFRSFVLYFRSDAGGEGEIPFRVVASDSGLLAGPVAASKLALAMAERWEVVFDFSKFAGQNVTLLNQGDVERDNSREPGPVEQVMRFVVGRDAAAADTSVVPDKLRDVPFPPSKGDGVDRRFLFNQQDGLWKINGVGFRDVENRILAKVPRGTVEVWEFENGGGGAHPVHVHLVDFRILSRTGAAAARPVLPYEAAGLKDVVWLGPGEVVRVEAHYAPWDGVYMFHCHNMIHEDHEMMAAFNVTSLAGFGYDETSFADPMDPRWRAVPVEPAAFSSDAVAQKVRAMAALQPYSLVDDVREKLAQYWSARGGPGTWRPKGPWRNAVVGPAE